MSAPGAAAPLAPARLLALLLLTSVVVSADDWPSFLGPNRDGHSRETGILVDWKAGGPPLVWQREVGDGYATPVVAGGRLFHTDRVGDHARLTAMNATTGAVLWQVTTPLEYEDYYGYSNGPRASPVVDPGRSGVAGGAAKDADGERVYTHGVDGRLQCRRTEDGALVWEVDTQRDFGFLQNFFGVASAPLVEGDLLIVPIGGSPPGSPPIHSGKVTGNGSGLVAFDKSTGKVRWRTSDQLASYASPVVRVIRGQRLGLHFARGGLLAFDPASGVESFFYPWRAPRLESVNAATPVVVGDEVLITESYGPGASLLRVTGDGYQVVWKDGSRPKLAAHWSTPIVHDGFIYASSGEKSGSAELVCLEWKTGAVRWSQPGLYRSTLLYVDGHLVVLTEYGQLLLVRATPERFEAVATSDLRDSSGRPLVRHPAWGAPILANGLLYLKGEGRLVALRLIP